MSVQSIFDYALESALFALLIVGAYAAARRLVRRKRLNLRRDWPVLALTAYLAAVTEIIALRFGHPSETRVTRLFPPFATTSFMFSEGAWPFLYHTLGNLSWFVPLGLLLPVVRPKTTVLHALLTGAALSVLLEALQWLLKTGTTDVDDVILNALGALLGWALYRIVSRIRDSKIQDKKEVSR